MPACCAPRTRSTPPTQTTQATQATSRHTACQQRGLSLVDCTIAMAVVSLLIAMLAPNLSHTRDRRHLELATAELETDMQHARSLATLQNRSLRIRFMQTEAGSCYVLHSGASQACSCTPQGTSTCSGDQQALKTVAFPTDRRLQMQSSAGSILFDAAKGTVTPTTSVQFSAQSGPALRAVVNLVGRVRACTAGGQLPGYARC